MRGYDGLFGPDTVTWRVHSDPVLWVAGLRALLLQAVHPAAMAGVLGHSDFRADPWGRLIRTANYVGTVSFGTHAEVADLGRRVRDIHSRVAGVDGVTGTTYRADDPALLRWVHCCEVESFLTTFQRAGGGLSRSEVDRYYREQSRAAQVVGLDPGNVPASEAEMREYFADIRSSLTVDARTRRIATYVILPPMPRWLALTTPARPAWGAVGALAFGLLPGWARRLYGMPGLPTTDLATTAWLRGLHALLQAAPERFREGPHVRAARQRLHAGSGTAAAG
jgi:uncharacterized protein (DUF2236 family)